MCVHFSMFAEADIPMEINIKDPTSAATHSIFAIICRRASDDPTIFSRSGHYYVYIKINNSWFRFDDCEKTGNPVLFENESLTKEMKNITKTAHSCIYVQK